MGVIDLDARVKKLEADSGSSAEIDQIEAAVTALENTVSGNGTTTFGLEGDVAALQAAAVPERTEVTDLPTGISAYSDYGGVFYETLGNLVHVHVAVSGLTAFTGTTIITLPEAVRPEYGDTPIAFGTGSATFGETGAFVLCKALSSPINGNVIVNSAGTYAIVDLWYTIGHPTT